MDRRSFLKTSVLVAAATAAIRSERTTNLKVFILRKKEGAKHSNAALKHFDNKIFPTTKAAVKKTPHSGVKCSVESAFIRVPATVDRKRLFDGRKDIDLRVESDMAHIRRCGVIKGALEKVFI